ncbi:MAG: hypothetical protein KAH14_01010 [Clostridiales bacterium]|nr:hypothetical protein [Clostridiales bacterium]
MFKVNYETAREEAGFTWDVKTYIYSLMNLADIKLNEFNESPTAGIEIYKDKYFNQMKEMFGDYIIRPTISTPPVSYGNINFLGVPLVFPKSEGEVNYEHQHKSLDEWIEILKSNMEFKEMTEEGRFFIDYRGKLQEAYPDKNIYWNMSYEGPITTAYELMDTEFFYGLFDEPEKIKEFLRVLTLSTVEYTKFHHRINGIPEFNTEGAGICDDIASMISPDMFEKIVLPYWEMYFSGVTSGKRHIHTEDHTYKTMRFFEKVNINSFDPSISPKLNPQLIRDNSRVPFYWRLGSFHYADLSVQDVKDWVYKAVEDGASNIFTGITHIMLDPHTVAKVKAFQEAADNAKSMFDAGATRDEIGKLVSVEGRKKFWDQWPEGI